MIIERTGELCIWANEGGYCSPTISIKPKDGDDTTIEEMIELIAPGIDFCGGAQGIQVRITIERIKEDDA